MRVRVAEREQHLAVAIHHGTEPAVTAFDQIASSNFDGNGVLHGLS